jgi:hypothetical protein
MNKVIREHYPAAKLPKELRGDIDPSRVVTVTVIEEAPQSAFRSLDEIFRRTRKRTLSEKEIIELVRAERDSWDA